ncbi:MAG: serine hydrolase, partial [Rhizobacter sp.]|nr:serine hydrolase [Rhizobacter sp.]
MLMLAACAMPATAAALAQGGAAKASKVSKTSAGLSGASARPTGKAPSVRRAAAGAGLKLRKRKFVMASIVPAKPSFGQLYGLHATEDALELKSSVALVVDQDTDEVLFSKNSGAVLPIASITKLMTALVVTEAGQSLDEMLTVSQDDVSATAGSSSRLRPGTQLSRGEMLHLALMSS